jgi:hypothetical protein
MTLTGFRFRRESPKRAAADRRPPEQSNGPDGLSAILAGDRAFSRRVGIVELGRRPILHA